MPAAILPALVALVAIALSAIYAASAPASVCESVDGGCAQRASSGACEQCADLLSKSTWGPLNARARATLFIAAAATGELGSGLRSCAQVMLAADFESPLEKEIGAAGSSSRGAAAAVDLKEGFACLIPEAELLSVTTARSLFKTPGDGRQAQLLSDPRPAAKNTAGDERGQLALLVMRERARPRSKLAPYIHTFLSAPPPDLPAAWDPQSEEGKARRGALAASQPGGINGSRLLLRADFVRRSIARHYAQLVPRAISAMPSSLSEGLPCSLGSSLGGSLGGKPKQGASSCSHEELSAVYSLQRFVEVWCAITARDFVNSRQLTSAEPLGAGGTPFPATFLVPLIDLMNHGGAESTMRVTYDLKLRGFVMRAVRRVLRGEQLTFRYSSQLCREEAFTIYGFSDQSFLPCTTTVVPGD